MEQDKMLELADRFRELDETKKALAEQQKTIQAELDATEKELVDLMILREMPNFSRSGKMYYIESKIVGSAAGGKKDELYTALRENGYGDLIQETIPAQTLSAFVKEQIAITEQELEENGNEVEGTPIPSWLGGLVNVFEQTKVRMRKAK
jgi:hypothetical protein